MSKRHVCPPWCHVCPLLDGDVMPMCMGTAAMGSVYACTCKRPPRKRVCKCCGQTIYDIPEGPPQSALAAQDRIDAEEDI